MDRGAWWATVHGVTKSQTRLKRLITNRHVEVQGGCPSPQKRHQWEKDAGVCRKWKSLDGPLGEQSPTPGRSC